ncbi:ABC transporter ATP-binding protein [Actinocorallia longicatena]|uniref:ABC transporter ATP-binding protein n=1 Tax=Actinocorallia longicatena TaxID=111803 RepID=A0ABP6Q8G5_9ACTN
MAGSDLTISALTVSYGPVRALRGVDLEVPHGRIVAVLGGNGAGKSTLLRAISGTLRFHRGGVTSGDVRYGGKALGRLGPAGVVAAGVVQVPEGRHVFGRMTVAENLRAGAIGAPRGGQTDRVKDWVHELFPVLVDRAGQRAGLLSGGEQQMLAIGRALMARPKVLLLDEPTLGLAPQMAERIARTIERINAEGTGVLLVEQNASLALRLAHSAYLLEVGEVTLSGPAEELAATDEIQRRYLGIDTAMDIPDFPTLRRWEP